MSASSADDGLATYDSAALRAIEQAAALRLGGDDVLMQRAGMAAWRAILAHWPSAQRIVVACGPGNNGGDGYVVALHAAQAGRAVSVLHLATHAPRGAIAIAAHDAFVDAGGRVERWTGGLPACDLVVDALFGVGLARAPADEAVALIEAINAAGAPVLAVDVPSGVDADRGHVPGAAVVATRTLQCIAAHPGLATGAALDHVGAGDVATLEVPEDLVASQRVAALVVDRSHLTHFLAPRRRDTHKGESGRVLCIGGDHGKGGALMLCAEAALRSGAGLVDAATHAEHVPALLVRRAEIMAHVAEAVAVRTLSESARVIAIGPGLGQGDWAQALLSIAVASGRPLVIDADALNLLASSPHDLPTDAVLTPHPGEAARLLGTTTRDVQADRFAAVHALRDRFRCTVVLKGAGTLVAAPGAITRVIAAGNPGMAVGGMGDVLTGVIAALRAQSLSSFDAALCGALLHSAAGDAAAGEGGERGLLPSDLFLFLRRLANP